MTLNEDEIGAMLRHIMKPEGFGYIEKRAILFRANKFLNELKQQKQQKNDRKRSSGNTGSNGNSFDFERIIRDIF